MNTLKLSALILTTTALVTGCGSPRSLSVAPGTRLTAITQPEPTPRTVPSFTMTALPASVQAPLPCPGCIGVGYDSDASISVQLSSVNFIGIVNLSVTGLPAGVTLASPISPVLLNVGDGAANQVVSANLYVLAGTLPGSYPLTIVGTPAAGSNSTAPVSLPVVLTVTSAASAAWRAQ